MPGRVLILCIRSAISPSRGTQGDVAARPGVGRAALGAPWGRSGGARQAIWESEATGNISNTDPHVKVLILYHVFFGLNFKSIASDCDLT